MKKHFNVNNIYWKYYPKNKKIDLFDFISREDISFNVKENIKSENSALFTKHLKPDSKAIIELFRNLSKRHQKHERLKYSGESYAAKVMEYWQKITKNLIFFKNKHYM